MKTLQDKELAQLRESLENQKAELEALGQEVPSLRKEIMHFVEQTNRTVHASAAPFFLLLPFSALTATLFPRITSLEEKVTAIKTTISRAQLADNLGQEASVSARSRRGKQTCQLCQRSHLLKKYISADSAPALSSYQTLEHERKVASDQGNLGLAERPLVSFQFFVFMFMQPNMRKLSSPRSSPRSNRSS